MSHYSIAIESIVWPMIFMIKGVNCHVHDAVAPSYIFDQVAAAAVAEQYLESGIVCLTSFVGGW